MRLQRQNILVIALVLMVFVSATMTGDWSPWAEGFFGVLAILLAMFSREIFFFGKFWFAPERWMALTLVITGVTIFWSTNYYASGRMWGLLLLGFLTFVAARSIEEGQRVILLKWFAVVTTAGALWALVDQFRTHVDRAEGFLQNANALGGLLVLGLPISLALAHQVSGWQRWLWWGSAAIVAITLLRTMSLTGLAALTIAGLCYVVLFRRKVFQRRVLARITVVIAVLILSAMAFRSAQFHSMTKGVRLDQVITAQHFSSSFTQRWYFIRSAVRMVQDHPLAGLGLGTFQQNYPGYAATIFEQPRYAHNHFLEIAAEAGIFAGLVFIGLVVVIVVHVFRNVQSHAMKKEWWYIGMAFGILATTIHSLFDFGWHFPAVWFGFWIMAGISYPRYTESPTRRVIAPLVLFLLSILAFTRALSVAASFTPFQRGTSKLDNGQPQEAVANFIAGLRWDPDPYRRRQLANALWIMARGDEAILHDAQRQAEVAIRWARTDYNGYRIAARIAFAQKSFPDANHFFLEAIRLDNFFHPDIYSEYMNFLIAQGRYADARAIGVEVQGQYTSSVWSSNPYVQSDLAFIRTLLQSIEGKE